MKKISIATLVLGLCVSAHTVSLSWSASGATAAIYGLNPGTTMTYGATSQTSSMIVYFFNYNDYDTIIGKGKVEASEVSSFAVATATGNPADNASAAGRIKASTATTSFTSEGNNFFARVYATFDEKTYFIDLFAGGGTDGVWTNAKSGDQSVQEKLAWSAPPTGSTWGGSTSNSVGAKNTWVAVPEPSTAMLALAGLALLIKRRKA